MDKIVKNDGRGLVELLGLNEGTLKHQGNYYFIAVKDESRVDIYTEPTDESNDYIRVNAVYIDGDERGNTTRILMQYLSKSDSQPRRKPDL